MDLDIDHVVLTLCVNVSKNQIQSIHQSINPLFSSLLSTKVCCVVEGKAAAEEHECKYIEVSAAIDHKIDELLVGILKQIRLIKEQRNVAARRRDERRASRGLGAAAAAAGAGGSGGGGVLGVDDDDDDDEEASARDAAAKFCCPFRASNNTLINKLFGRSKRHVKSCENLYVL